jgi:transposase
VVLAASPVAQALARCVQTRLDITLYGLCMAYCIANSCAVEGWPRWRRDEPTDHALGRSLGGFSTKIHLLSDGNGLPLDACLTPGQTHESTQVETVLSQVAIPRASGRVRRRPRRLAADRAYDAQRIRHWLRLRGISPAIPPKRRTGKRKRGRPVTYNRDHYRRRSTIEQCVGWLKECRAIATRYEKLALNYLGLVKLAFIERYLRLLKRAVTIA